MAIIHFLKQESLNELQFQSGLLLSPEVELESDHWRKLNLSKLYEECSSGLFRAPTPDDETRREKRSSSFKKGVSIIDDDGLPLGLQGSPIVPSNVMNFSSLDSQYNSFLRPSQLLLDIPVQESYPPQRIERVSDDEFLESIITTQENIEKEFIRLPNADMKDPGAYSFLVSAKLSRTVTSLQRDVLLLRNELLFMRFLHRHQNECIRELYKKSIENVENQSQVQNMVSKLQIQHAKIKSLQSSLESTRQEFKEYKERQQKWENELQLKISKLTSDRQMLSEHNIGMSEEYELIRRELEVCKSKLNEKANANLQLQARLDEALARIPHAAQFGDRSLQMLQQIQVLSNLLQNVQKSEEEWKGKCHLATALHAKLKSSLDKQTMALNDIPRFQTEIASLEKEVAHKESQVKEARQIVEKTHMICEAKMNATEEKYRIVRDLNRRLEDQLSKLMIQLSERKSANS
eukprot:TRINITY_DN2161_c0_g1_i3.p1 TRINITY_DN2161_c0_g1~~TRINITY_DN2161_c0_g1_i3.p1  ORF type:complete len:463 (+),score=93.94 TRINITY_DN2161_c0_g1_i3:1033-2421(+)